jgi:hypothetical protein
MNSSRVNEGDFPYVRLGVSYCLLQRVISEEILRDFKSRWVQAVSWPAGSEEVSKIIFREFTPIGGDFFLLFAIRIERQR